MGKKYTRKNIGGDVDITQVKETIEKLKIDINQITEDVNELGKRLELKNEISENEANVDFADVYSSENVSSAPSENVSSAPPETDNSPPPVPPQTDNSLPPVPPQTAQDIKQKEITVNNYIKQGNNFITQDKKISIDNLLQMVDNKKRQSKNLNNKYADFINKANNIIKNSKTENKIEEIQSLWKNSGIEFKNDNVMGGKTKKLQKKSRKHNKTRK